MNRGVLILLLLIAFGLGAAAGAFGYIWVTGGSGEASQPIEEVAESNQLSLGGQDEEPDYEATIQALEATIEASGAE